jgi:hypothetical protein
VGNNTVLANRLGWEPGALDRRVRGEMMLRRKVIWSDGRVM